MCSAKPRYSVKKFDERKNGHHCVGEPVYIGTCQNMLCEGSSCDCCRPLGFERIQVEVNCLRTDNKNGESFKDKHVVSMRIDTVTVTVSKYFIS